jgi:uncharacterized phage protein gp47/JayE
MPVYGSKNKGDILVTILNNLERSAGISAVHPGSIARAFAESMSEEISDLYESLKFSIEQSNLSTASGRNLDLIGDLYDVPRKSITESFAQERQSFNIEFFIDTPNSTDIIIPDGTLVFNDVSNFTVKQYSFRLVNDVRILAGSRKAYGRVVSNFQDNTYVAPRNSLTKHNFISPALVNVYVTNPKEVYSDITGESDDNYRRRIISSLKSKAAGTAESVRFAALSTKGIRDVRIREGSFGIGSCDVIVVPEVAAETKRLPNTVLASISSVKPVGIRFNVSIAERVFIGVNANITLSIGTSENVARSIVNQANLFAKRYLNSLTVGSTVSLTDIQFAIQNASDLIQSVVITSFSADGRELPLQNFSLPTVRSYPAAGNVLITSATIGRPTY